MDTPGRMANRMIDIYDLDDTRGSRCTCSRSVWCPNAVKLILMGQKSSRRGDYGMTKVLAHIFYAHRMQELKRFAMAEDSENLSQCFERMDSIVNPISQTLIGVIKDKWPSGHVCWRPRWGPMTISTNKRAIT